ncbi:MAG: hypothetical protein GY803_18215 [Chloroflexi bacterium]|nr:hypothetical protein [Chloroflexota bacterium]
MTKKQLGLSLIALGAIAILALFGIDLVGAGQFQGVGPAQKRALIAAGFVIVVGATLLPLGDAPA